MYSLQGAKKLFREQLIEFTEDERIEAVKQVQKVNYSYPRARWNAFLNEICVLKVLEWLWEDYGIDEEQKPTIRDLEQVKRTYELINGTIFNIGDARVILIPSDAYSTDALIVEAEWVDIESLRGDFYLAVQVNLNEEDEDENGGGWLRVWGFTTHKRLKEHGEYESSTHKYELDEKYIFEDINLMVLAVESNLRETASLSPLPTLEKNSPEAKLLGKQVSEPSLYSPRFNADSFEHWCAFISDPQNIKQLVEQRTTPLAYRTIKELLQNLNRLVEEKIPKVSVAGQVFNRVEEIIGFDAPSFKLMPEYQLTIHKPELIQKPEPKNLLQSSPQKWVDQILKVDEKEGEIEDGNRVSQLIDDLMASIPDEDTVNTLGDDTINALILLAKKSKTPALIWETINVLSKTVPDKLSELLLPEIIGLSEQITFTQEEKEYNLKLNVCFKNMVDTDDVNVYIKLYSIDNKISLPINLQLVVEEKKEKDSPILIDARINEDDKNSKYMEGYCFFSIYEIFEIVIKLEAQQIIYKFSV